MEPLSDDEMAGPSTMRSLSNHQPEEEGAPRFRIPPRDLAAVEIPAVVENIDRAVKAFGRVPSLEHLMDPLRNSVPLYLNPESPFCKPIMSHNAASHNVVLKVTVPKRTGRRRRRGSNGPWQGDVNLSDAPGTNDKEKVQSIARLDEPKVLRRKLQDNAGRYHVEAVGTIKHTHRFRALADFYWDMNRSEFAQRYAEQVLPGDVQKLKEFTLQSGTDRPPNVDIIPPPIFTHMSLPFNYFYSQNPYVRTTEDGDTINLTAVKQVGYFISAEDPAPDGPQVPPDMTDPRMIEVLAQLEDAFQHRPLWTRRSLLNHLRGKLQSWNELKKYLNYAAYQFKGGPWRDSVVPYGTDPRTDPKYRIYQTLMFKLKKHKRTIKHQPWQSLRKTQIGESQNTPSMEADSHIFDGKSYHTDGKVWQVCDITDSLLKELLDNAAVRPQCDVVNSGWYHGGLWAKVKAIMKTKLVAIRFGRHLTKEDFAQTLEFGDATPIRTVSNTFHLPLPNLHLTTEEHTVLHGRGPLKKKSTGYNVRFRDIGKSPSVAHEISPAPFIDSSVIGTDRMESDDEDSGSERDDDDDEDEDDDGSDNEEYPDTGYYNHMEQYGDHQYGDGDAEMDMGRSAYPELD
ncbi:RNA polymerase III transcription factor (TF)IIIC subunit [Metarhizium robertsii]|uniref:RNA polymerase III transcription factor (TF)IIIC subunit n=1 Tax=Metarhizium robertsii TaxID=568076 RepID=A0A014NAG3_9HYPO|nr:RNA polymerase III transcription factor (TF)IIIC subunit [Metarhizium robertsii]